MQDFPNDRQICNSMSAVPFQSHPFRRRPVNGKASVSFFFNRLNTGSSIGVENKSHDFGNKVIEFLTLVQSCNLAIGTTRILVFPIALPDCTPCCFFIFVASGTFPFQIGAASAAVKSAISNQPFVCF